MAFFSSREEQERLSSCNCISDLSLLKCFLINCELNNMESYSYTRSLSDKITSRSVILKNSNLKSLVFGAPRRSWKIFRFRGTAHHIDGLMDWCLSYFVQTYRKTAAKVSSFCISVVSVVSKFSSTSNLVQINFIYHRTSITAWYYKSAVLL